MKELTICEHHYFESNLFKSSFGSPHKVALNCLFRIQNNMDNFYDTGVAV